MQLKLKSNIQDTQDSRNCASNNRTEQNKILFRTPKGYKAHVNTTYYIIDGIDDSVKFINDIQTNEIRFRLHIYVVEIIERCDILRRRCAYSCH